MSALRRFLREFYSAPFHLALVVSFTLVAAFTIGIGAWAISRTINEYLVETMNERVARDAHLAQAIYDASLSDMADVAENLSNDPIIAANLDAAGRGDAAALRLLEQRLAALRLSSSHLAAVLDSQGNVLVSRFYSKDGTDFKAGGGNWSALPIVQKALKESAAVSATEALPVEALAELGMAEQARIELVETPKAAPSVFDPREGSGGLTLVGISPVKDEAGELIGLTLSLHLFNNDFALVDRIRDIAQIDTVTIFLGDLRVSTNVTDAEGERAVGTRLAADVGEVVLERGQEYVGAAFVVKENYITRYEPLRNHEGRVIGILYVGARQASFFRLLDDVERRIMTVAIVMIALTFLLATPVTRVITNPLRDLRELAQVSKRVAQGEVNLRMPVSYGGEVGQLAREFNAMLDTLSATREQLVHSENLASLGQLAAGVAHEINNPLGAILLYSESMLKELSEDDPHRADLNVIVSETKRCKRIVGDLLNFSRQHQVIVQPTNVNALLQELIDMAPRRIKTVTIPIVSEFDPSLPLIDGDPAQLRQVFLNLMVNAVEAMPQGGTLTVRTRREPADMVAVEIQDTGVGISHEDIGKLFTPFFTTKPIGKGTGLGLAISYGIVKMHRGQINVRSEVGAGTVFTVRLPIKLPQTARDASPGKPEDGRILIG